MASTSNEQKRPSSITNSNSTMEIEELYSETEDYMNSYHYSLSPDDPGYESQRKQRIRNQPYFELTNFLNEGETVAQALKRFNLKAFQAKEKENQRKMYSKEYKSSRRIKEKKKPINFVRLTQLVKNLQQIPGNDDIMDADLAWICRKITAPLNSS